MKGVLHFFFDEMLLKGNQTYSSFQDVKQEFEKY
jgi:hypothetical protein